MPYRSFFSWGSSPIFNDYSNNLDRNGSIHNCSWIESTIFPYFVDDVALDKSQLKCKLFWFTHVCVVLCVMLAYYTFTPLPLRCPRLVFIRMCMIIVSNYTRCESLDMAHQCVAKEVMKTTFAINFTIMGAMGKRFLVNYL